MTDGIVSPRVPANAVVTMCAARVFRLILTEAVRDEVEANLLLHAASLPPTEGDRLLTDYHRLLELAWPEMIPYPDKKTVLAARGLIAHAADVPVLVSAQAAKPDWVLTNNRKHFTAEVAKRTGLRIAGPADFLRCLSIVRPVA